MKYSERKISQSILSLTIAVFSLKRFSIKEDYRNEANTGFIYVS